jgi:homoserine O-succinyltransferase/O-acetyltransferase
MTQTSFRFAMIDLYDGHENQGKRSIETIVHEFAKSYNLDLTYDVFDTRGKAEIPDLSYDAYLSTGGPGSPLDSEGSHWEAQFFNFVEQLRAHNRSAAGNKKPLFLICHSFQVFCRYYGLARVGLRKSTSFGVFPIHKTSFGKEEPFFNNLPETFWAADHRDYQVTKVDFEKMEEFGARLLCREKIRPHVPLERAVMAIRFSDYIFGTQFHPEADPVGMLHYFSMPEKREQIIGKYGEDKFDHMIAHLNVPGHLVLTHNTVIPSFLESALTYKLMLQA